MKKDLSCHRDFFHHHQLKNTPARDAVYHLLQLHQPITLDKLFSLVVRQSKGKKISYSTIYRILEQFLSVNIVEKMSLDIETTPLYQLKDETHHHHQMVCTTCKKITPIEECPLTEFELKMAKKLHFQPHHHQFTLYGICQVCQSASP